MFDDYAKKLEELGQNVPKIFKNVAKKGAIHAKNEAVKNTDLEKLVDTGAYRRNWNGEAVKLGENNAIILQNGMEYASYLEEGHKLKNGGRWKGRFVGKRAITDTEGWALLELENEVHLAMMQKKYGISRADAQKYSR